MTDSQPLYKQQGNFCDTNTYMLYCVLSYAGSHTLQLKDNYRSTPQVLRGAEGVLKNILGGPAARTPLVPLNAAGPQIEAGTLYTICGQPSIQAHVYTAIVQTPCAMCTRCVVSVS